MLHQRELSKNVYKIGVEDWDRRLFDALIPLPDGTSYNSYLVFGSTKTAIIDTVDPAMIHVLKAQLESVPTIDYIIANHAEQDHSGCIPFVLEKYPQAKVVVTPKCKDLLKDHLALSDDVFITVNDGDTLSLGDKTFTFLHTPWVHWPETMCSYLQEDKILFSCDFFGSHLASSDLYAIDKPRVYESAKRYYAEIMMPFRVMIRKNIDKVEQYPIAVIAPSHGPVYNEPTFIIDAYKDWVSETPKNNVVIPYISMHGSTRLMVEYLVSALARRGVTVEQFDMTVTDIGKVAIALVDAGTVIIGTPAVHVGPHPAVIAAAQLVGMLRPKVKFVSIIGSYGWGNKIVEQLSGIIGNLKVEVLLPVICKGLAKEQDYAALDALAQAVAERHAGFNSPA
jgi:flavorubredoxin